MKKIINIYAKQLKVQRYYDNNYINQKVHRVLFHLVSPRWLPSWTSGSGSSIVESISLFPTNITIFVIQLWRTWVWPGTFLSTTKRVTVHTNFFSSVSMLAILAIGHWFHWHSSFNSTISPTKKFGIFSTCSEILQHFVEQLAIVLWNTDLVD